MQRTEFRAGCHRLIGGPRRGPGFVGQNAHDRVEVAVHRVDAREMGLDDLETRNLPAADRSRQLPGAGAPEIVGHRTGGSIGAAIRGSRRVAVAAGQQSGRTGQGQGVNDLAP